MAIVRAGLQREYLESLDYLRNIVMEVEVDIQKLKREFYQCKDNSEEKYEESLKSINDQLLSANNYLRNKNVTLEVIDGEVKIIELLNKLRDQGGGDPECIATLTEFWDTIKTSLESFQTTLRKFQNTVLSRLKSNCLSYYRSDVHLDISHRYTEEIADYVRTLDDYVKSAQVLCTTFPNGVQQDLFTNTNFSERVLVCCDQKAFPVLRVVPDITEKLEFMCRVARKWIDRDETYVHEITNYIRQTRSETKKREEVLRNKRERHKRVVKSVRAAYILCQNNKEKLRRVQSELQTLDTQLSGFKSERRQTYEEKQQKESVADFLKISISQTKRNYNLQLKRSRLLKQVKELEHFLVDIEKQLSDISEQITTKSEEKVAVAEKVDVSKKSYLSLKGELNKFTKELDKLVVEVNGLSSQLLHLEIIQTIKTCPETLEDMYDRPVSVKLAPSLKEKIMRKRKMLSDK